MVKAKGIGGKKHRRGKNIQISHKVDIPDTDQYFGLVDKSLGCGKVKIHYYKSISKDNENNNLAEVEWTKKEAIGVIRGKMLRRIFVNAGDIILITERDFDIKKVDIIGRFDASQLDYLKDHMGKRMPNFNKLNHENDVLFQDKNCISDIESSESDSANESSANESSDNESNANESNDNDFNKKKN